MQKIDVYKDYVIGFNFAALADIRFDMYFCELANRHKERWAASDLPTNSATSRADIMELNLCELSSDIDGTL